MLATQNNARLPPEVLKEIFKNVAGKNGVVLYYMNRRTSNYSITEDLINSSLVCKSWRYVIQEYFTKDVSIIVDKMMLPTLYNRIALFDFALKSIEIRDVLNLYDHDQSREALINFWDILKSCPNLISLRLSMSVINNLTYMKASLAKIKNICLLEGDTISTAPQAQFISSFPDLTQLEIRFGDDRVFTGNVDLKLVLESAPQLQELRMQGISKLTADFQGESIESDIKSARLISLTLRSYSMDINSLEYITSAILKYVDNLYFSLSYLIPDYALSEEESKKILDDFHARISGIKNISIIYTYKNKLVRLNNDEILSRPMPIVSDSSGDEDILLSFYDDDRGDVLWDSDDYIDAYSYHIFQYWDYNSDYDIDI